jgi:hypothetical protein
MRFIDPTRMPSIPRSFRGTLPNGSPFRLLWDSGTVVWSNYYQSVRSFLSSNGVTNLPSEEEIQNFMCQGASAGCTGDPNFHAPSQVAQTHHHQPCSTCGKRY